MSGSLLLRLLLVCIAVLSCFTAVATARSISISGVSALVSEIVLDEPTSINGTMDEGCTVEVRGQYTELTIDEGAALPAGCSLTIRGVRAQKLVFNNPTFDSSVSILIVDCVFRHEGLDSVLSMKTAMRYRELKLEQSSFTRVAADELSVTLCGTQEITPVVCVLLPVEAAAGAGGGAAPVPSITLDRVTVSVDGIVANAEATQSGTAAFLLGFQPEPTDLRTAAYSLTVQRSSFIITCATELPQSLILLFAMLQVPPPSRFVFANSVLDARSLRDAHKELVYNSEQKLEFPVLCLLRLWHDADIFPASAASRLPPLALDWEIVGNKFLADSGHHTIYAVSFDADAPVRVLKERSFLDISSNTASLIGATSNFLFLRTFFSETGANLTGFTLRKNSVLCGWQPNALFWEAVGYYCFANAHNGGTVHTLIDSNVAEVRLVANVVPAAKMMESMSFGIVVLVHFGSNTTINNNVLSFTQATLFNESFGASSMFCIQLQYTQPSPSGISFVAQNNTGSFHLPLFRDVQEEMMWFLLGLEKIAGYRDDADAASAATTTTTTITFDRNTLSASDAGVKTSLFFFFVQLHIAKMCRQQIIRLNNNNLTVSKFAGPAVNLLIITVSRLLLPSAVPPTVLHVENNTFVVKDTAATSMKMIIVTATNGHDVSELGWESLALAVNNNRQSFLPPPRGAVLPAAIAEPVSLDFYLVHFYFVSIRAGASIRSSSFVINNNEMVLESHVAAVSRTTMFAASQRSGQSENCMHCNWVFVDGAVIDVSSNTIFINRLMPAGASCSTTHDAFVAVARIPLQGTQQVSALNFNSNSVSAICGAFKLEGLVIEQDACQEAYPFQYSLDQNVRIASFSVSRNTLLCGDPCPRDAPTDAACYRASPRGCSTATLLVLARPHQFRDTAGVFVSGLLTVSDNTVDMQQLSAKSSYDERWTLLLAETIRAASSLVVARNYARFRRTFVVVRFGLGIDMSGNTVKQEDRTDVLTSFTSRWKMSIENDILLADNYFVNIMNMLWICPSGAKTITAERNTLIFTMHSFVSFERCADCVVDAGSIIRLSSNTTFVNTQLIMRHNKVLAHSDVETAPPAIMSLPASKLSTNPFAAYLLVFGGSKERIFYTGSNRILLHDDIAECFVLKSGLVMAPLASLAWITAYVEVVSGACTKGLLIFPQGRMYAGAPPALGMSGSLELQRLDWAAAASVFSEDSKQQPLQHSFEFVAEGNRVVALGCTKVNLLMFVSTLPGTSRGNRIVLRNNTMLMYPGEKPGLGAAFAAVAFSTDETSPSDANSACMETRIEDNYGEVFAAPGQLYVSAILPRQFRRAATPLKTTSFVHLALAFLTSAYVMPLGLATYEVNYLDRASCFSLSGNTLKTASAVARGNDSVAHLGLLSPKPGNTLLAALKIPGFDFIANSLRVFSAGNKLYSSRSLRREGGSAGYRKTTIGTIELVMPQDDPARGFMNLSPFGGSEGRRYYPIRGPTSIAVGTPCGVVYNFEQQKQRPPVVVNSRVLLASFFRDQLPPSTDEQQVTVFQIDSETGERVEDERHALCSSFSHTMSRSKAPTSSRNITPQVTLSRSKTRFEEPRQFGMSPQAAAVQAATANSLGALAAFAAPSAALSAARAMAVFALLSCGSTPPAALGKHAAIHLWFGWQLEAPAAVGLFVAITIAAVAGALIIGSRLEQRRRKSVEVTLEQIEYEMTLIRHRRQQRSREEHDMSASADEDTMTALKERRALARVQQHAATTMSSSQRLLAVAPLPMFTTKAVAQLAGMWAVAAGVLCASGGGGGIVLAVLPLLLVIASLGLFAWKTHQQLHPRRKPNQRRPPARPPQVTLSLVYVAPSKPSSSASSSSTKKEGHSEVSKLAARLLSHPVGRFAVTGWYCWAATSTDSFFDSREVFLSPRRLAETSEEYTERQHLADLLMRNKTTLIKFWGPLDSRSRRRDIDSSVDMTGMFPVASTTASRSRNSRNRFHDEETTPSPSPSSFVSSWIYCHPSVDLIGNRSSTLTKLRTTVSPHYLVASIITSIIVCITQGAANAVGDRTPNGGCTHAMRVVAGINFVFACFSLLLRPHLIPLQNVIVCSVEAVIAIVGIAASAAVFGGGKLELGESLQQAVSLATIVASAALLLTTIIRSALLLVAKGEIIPRCDASKMAKAESQRQRERQLLDEWDDPLLEEMMSRRPAPAAVRLRGNRMTNNNILEISNSSSRPARGPNPLRRTTEAASVPSPRAAPAAAVARTAAPATHFPRDVSLPSQIVAANVVASPHRRRSMSFAKHFTSL